MNLCINLTDFIDQEIEKILEKYENGNLYNQYRYEITELGEYVEFDIKNELKEFCKSNDINYTYEVTDKCDSWGENYRFGSITCYGGDSKILLSTSFRLLKGE